MARHQNNSTCDSALIPAFYQTVPSPLPEGLRNDTAFMDRIHAYFPGWDAPKLNKTHFTDHFGLVGDFLSECWSQLRKQGRSSELMGRVQLGSALSGRDTKAVQKTVSGLLKLLYPDPEMEVPDEDLEWAVELALESRRRVKEQQKRIGSAEFRNTNFSYRMGPDGIGTFVATPEIESEDRIGSDPLPPGQVWTASRGTDGEHAGLCRIEVKSGPGSGVKVLNQPTPAVLQRDGPLRRAESIFPVRRACGAGPGASRTLFLRPAPDI
nr:BREX system Lon protease-like protein BrxL [Salinibacter ruber]